MVPTLISLAHSRVLTAFFVHRKLQGSELISYFLASLGDFSWPFVSILTWPLTVLGYGDVETLVEELEEYRSRGDSVIIIDQAMLRRLNISGFPFTYIVDEMGKILHSWRGNSPSITTDIIETTINSFI